MSGSRRQETNVEKFVRENANLMARENPDSATHHRLMFKCKDCDREYHSFQALGGHRAGHKKLIKTPANSNSNSYSKHECKICGKGFAIGQALGGHMRKHRNHGDSDWATAIVVYNSSSMASSLTSSGKELRKFDLNLTPEENLSINGVLL